MKALVSWYDHRGFVLVSALVLVTISGCGGRDKDELPAVAAAGKVTYKGSPVSKGTMYFLPDKGRPSTGIIKDGSFTLTTYTDGDGAVAGKHQVGVLVTEEVPTKGGDFVPKYLIPEKYSQPENSGIAIDIPPAGNTNIQIDIK
ncbi:hypothetical protein [Singulisphaera acidiphila]|uniref:Carboxypeptidase regulatory-like domain-containing protein n=1 Tax=Singulisphaera acidiphila (strain ATCC BAA-1392 / DSM 18658 / VKM B-2454 / MOB10) TaxID=886293 RepID=L0DP99_SINAD|nr:hypothetical protein [Singulisphaera acidiphila]AGA30673.1 hypothetical protein Sinac_6598 [Singulisphaera acidiphila DSM 18658]